MWAHSSSTQAIYWSPDGTKLAWTQNPFLIPSEGNIFTSLYAYNLATERTTFLHRSIQAEPKWDEHSQYINVEVFAYSGPSPFGYHPRWNMEQPTTFAVYDLNN